MGGPPAALLFVLLLSAFGCAHGQNFTSAMDALQSRADCSTFAQLVAAAGLTPMLSNSSLSGTVFAPNNA